MTKEDVGSMSAGWRRPIFMDKWPSFRCRCTGCRCTKEDAGSMNAGWRRPILLDQFPSYCFSIIAMLVSLFGLLCSLLVIFSCNFEYTTLEVESPSGDLRQFQLSLGIFRYAAHERGSNSGDEDGWVAFVDSASCEAYEGTAIDGKLRGAKALTILAPVVAALGCVLCGLGLYWPSKGWLPWGMILAWFVACSFQLLGHIAFQSKDFCSGENGYGECEYGTGMAFSLMSVQMYFMAVVGSYVTIRYRKLALFEEPHRQRKQVLAKADHHGAKDDDKSVDHMLFMDIEEDEEVPIVDQTFEESSDSSMPPQSFNGSVMSVDNWDTNPHLQTYLQFDHHEAMNDDKSDEEMPFDEEEVQVVDESFEVAYHQYSCGAYGIVLYGQNEVPPPAEDEEEDIPMYDFEFCTEHPGTESPLQTTTATDLTPASNELSEEDKDSDDECRSCPDTDPDLPRMQHRTSSL